MNNIVLQIIFLIILQGCTGTTRPLGAGAIIKKSGAMFGPKEPTLITEKVSSESSEPFKYTDKRYPEVPKRSDKPVLGIKTNKNFITANAVQAILQGSFSNLLFHVN